MIVLKIAGWVLLVLLAMLTAALFVPLGATVRFGAEGHEMRLRIGPLRLKPKKLPAGKKKESAPKADGETQKPPKKSVFLDLSRGELTQLAKLALDAAGKTCRRVRIDPMELSLTLGGDDPAALAERYGYASAALWTLMPRAEEAFNLPDPCVRIGVDWEGGPTRAEGRVGATLRPWDAVVIALALARPFLRWRAERKARIAAKDTGSTEEKLSA